jgi:hypothetical protein
MGRTCECKLNSHFRVLNYTLSFVICFEQKFEITMVNPLLTLEEAQESVKNMSDWILSQNGTVVVETLPSFYEFFQQYLVELELVRIRIILLQMFYAIHKTILERHRLLVWNSPLEVAFFQQPCSRQPKAVLKWLTPFCPYGIPAERCIFPGRHLTCITTQRAVPRLLPLGEAPSGM